jgi:hypothetical protein
VVADFAAAEAAASTMFSIYVAGLLQPFGFMSKSTVTLRDSVFWLTSTAPASACPDGGGGGSGAAAAAAAATIRG